MRSLKANKRYKDFAPLINRKDIPCADYIVGPLGLMHTQAYTITEGKNVRSGDKGRYD